MSKKIDKVKKHFSDNKQLYLGIGIGAVVTAAVAYLIIQGKDSVDVTAIQKGYTITGDVSNTINQIIEVGISRPGPKSFVIQCLESQKTWPSMRSAAEDLGVNPGKLSSHLNGKFPDVNGLHFEKLAEV